MSSEAPVTVSRHSATKVSSLLDAATICVQARHRTPVSLPHESHMPAANYGMWHSCQRAAAVNAWFEDLVHVTAALPCYHLVLRDYKGRLALVITSVLIDV